MRRSLAMLSAAVAVLALAGCGDDADGEVVVFAAASLTDAFVELGEAFEAQHPDRSVRFSFAGSSSQREQLLDGAPADVFASADEANMAQALDAGVVGSADVFATNRPQIVVPAGNPAGVRGLPDFARDDLLLGLCAEQVPCGDLARRVLDAAGVTPSLDTEEPDVRALLTKVEAGELDAGIVYVTDVAAAGDGVEGIDVADRPGAVATYRIGTVADASDPDGADAFVGFVLGTDGQAILAAHGFGAP